MLLTMTLIGCDRGGTEPAAARKTGSDVVSSPVDKAGAGTQASVFRVGPHGGYDPHAALSPDKLVQVALQHLAEGRERQALETLDEAIARFPSEASLLGVRGSVLLERGDVSAALSDLEAAVALQPDNPVSLINRAQTYRQFGRIAEALSDLDRAIDLAPDNVAARFNRGAIRFSSGDHAGALEDFDRCIALEPHAPAPYFNRAAARDALGDRSAAIVDLQRFMELADNKEWKQTAQKLLDTWRAGTERTDAGTGG